MKRLLSVILILFSFSVFADDHRSVNNDRREESRNGKSDRREESRSGRHYGYYRSHDGNLVWGLIGLTVTSEIIESVSEPRKRVVYVQQPTVVYVQPQVIIQQPSPVYIDQLPVVIRTQPLFYYPDGRLVH